MATAKNGSNCVCLDVRMASKEQVESLGGKFLSVEGAENLETEGQLRKKASEEFKKTRGTIKETSKKLILLFVLL